MSYADPQDTSRRSASFAAVVVFHIVLVYALVNGLARKIVEVVQAPLETKIIEEVKPPPPDKPPPPPPPRMAAPPPPFIPPVEVRIDTPPPVQSSISAVSSVKPANEAPIPRPVVTGPSRSPAVVDASKCSKPAYPPASVRAQETGLVVLQFLIGADSSVIESKIERSSGFRRLDEAARQALSLCKFKAGTEEGKAVQSWARIEYLWKLDD
ncbi:MAG: TonB family protein [Rhodocyclaceae bacterium]|nr:TonB family protein [Rhodocyclaceae bacterium]MBP7081016.1 TonB family protein [Rhodocyclaceae bacterium]